MDDMLILVSLLILVIVGMVIYASLLNDQIAQRDAAIDILARSASEDDVTAAMHCIEV